MYLYFHPDKTKFRHETGTVLLPCCVYIYDYFYLHDYVSDNSLVPHEHIITILYNSVTYIISNNALYNNYADTFVARPKVFRRRLLAWDDFIIF